MEVLANARDSLQKPKLVVDLHGDLAVEQLERADHSLIWRWHWYGRTRFKERKNMTHMSAFTAVSHNLLQYPQSLKKPAIVLWGGVDLEKFQPTTLPPSAHIQVAYAGNYRPYQGVSILLQAAQHLIRAGEPFHFTFIGDMEAFPKQAALAHSLGNRVTLTGPVPFAQVPAWLGKADILVTPRAPGRSAYYNYPSKLSEQLAMGKAVIVTDVGEAGRLVQDGKTGLLIRPNSVDAMIEALLRLKDEPLRQQLGWAARAFAEEHLAWPRLAEKLAAFFQELSRAPAQV
jgi:glycosyltransferase involved in cell wall biosynthesis